MFVVCAHTPPKSNLHSLLEIKGLLVSAHALGDCNGALTFHDAGTIFQEHFIFSNKTLVDMLPELSCLVFLAMIALLLSFVCFYAARILDKEKQANFTIDVFDRSLQLQH